MKTTKWYYVAPVLVLVAGAWTLAFAQAPKSDTRAEFMRQKLDHTRSLLEGLTREDFTQITRSAKALRALSEAADWAEPKLGAQTRYGWYSLEFQELTDEIAARASAKNLDGATLGYVQLVANCVRCHRHVRGAGK